MTIPSPEERVAKFLRQIDLELLSGGGLRGPVLPMGPAVFGGLVLAQTMMAAGHGGFRGEPASLHGHFLAGGRHEDAVYRVEHLRESRSFATRRVSAWQGDRLFFEATVTFAAPDLEGISHALPMPAAPDPESAPYWWNSTPGASADHEANNRRWLSRHPLDVRTAETGPQAPPPARLPHRAVWLKPAAPLPDSPLVHAAAIAYASDFGVVSTVGNAYNAGGAELSGLSLDHVIWWHHPPRYDGWLLYVTDSPAGHHGRGLAWGGMWDEDGRRTVSVAQEGLYRRRSPG